MAEYKFKCPQCGNTRLVEYMANVTVCSEIDRVIDDEIGGIVYGDQTNEDGEVVHICCAQCGASLLLCGGVGRLPNTMDAVVTTEEELIEWLKSHMAN